MDNITKILPDGIYLFDKTVKFGDKLNFVSFNISVAVIILVCVGIIFSFIHFRGEEPLLIITIPVLIGAMVLLVFNIAIATFATIRPEYTYNEYKVSISESADTDKLNDNFIVIDKNDFVWTIVNREDVENHVVTVEEYKD